MHSHANLAACPQCGGTARVDPDISGYDGCPLCNCGDGPTGFVQISATANVTSPDFDALLDDGFILQTPDGGTLVRA